MPLPTRRLLIEAVHAAAGGDSLISPSVAVWLLEHLSPPQHTENSAATQRLSPQEHKIVRFVARGRTSNEIPEKLTLSLSTAKSHLSRIQDKLRARNRVEIARGRGSTESSTDADGRRMSNSRSLPRPQGSMGWFGTAYDSLCTHPERP